MAPQGIARAQAGLAALRIFAVQRAP